MSSHLGPLAATGGDAKQQAPPVAAVYVNHRERLGSKLGSYAAFQNARPEFIHMLLVDAKEEHFEQGQVCLNVGAVCGFGTTPLYIVLSGHMVVENRSEVVLGHVYEGDMFGEGGAIGLTEERSATVRASKGEPSTLLRIEGSVLEAALVAYPEERDNIEDTYYRRMSANQEFEKCREHWVATTVVPALEGTALFGGCPDELLYAIAGSLTEKTYKLGQVVCMCGEPADSMLLILEGLVEIEAKNGTKISAIGPGATFGEVAALEIFNYRTATIRSTARTRVLSVTAKALSNAIKNSPEPLVRRAFSRLAESRHEQVQKGLPMCALPINAKADDVCVRAVALQAERIELQPGQAWPPLSDLDACGPHFGVLVKGKAALETVEEQRFVCMLTAGSLIPEGLCSEYRTHIRAITPCEGYRVRQNDFLVSVYSMPSAQEWFYRFRLMDRRTRAHLSSRLSSVRGVTQGTMHQPSDDDIHEWKTRRQRAVEKARIIKGETTEAVAKLPLMLQSSAHSFLDSPHGRLFRADTRMTQTDRQAMSRMHSAPELSQQSAGSETSDPWGSMRLPKLQQRVQTAS